MREDDIAKRTKGPDCMAFLRSAPRAIAAIGAKNKILAALLYVGIGALVRALHALDMEMCDDYNLKSVEQFKYWSHVCIRALIALEPAEYMSRVWPQIFFELVPSIHRHLYQVYGLSYKEVSCMQPQEHLNLRCRQCTDEHSSKGLPMEKRIAQAITSWNRRGVFSAPEFVPDVNTNIITCSRCLQQGHKRSNKKCPLHEEGIKDLVDLYPDIPKFADKLDLEWMRYYGYFKPFNA